MNNLKNNLNSFNEGGKHSQNPLGGIPQGIGQNGKPNMVEQGETSYNSGKGKYIFSDSINTTDMNSDLINEFNLPKYTKGKSFSKASEAINNKFKDRNDKASLKTKEELLNRLQEAQEYVKMQSALENNSEEVPDMMNGEIPEEMNQFNLGGLLSDASKGANPLDLINPAIDMFDNLSGNNVSTDPTKAGLTGVAKGAMAGLPFGVGGAGLGALIGGVTGLIGSGKAKTEELLKQKNETQGYANSINNTFEMGGNIDPDPIYPTQKRDNTNINLSNKDRLFLLDKFMKNNSTYNDGQTFKDVENKKSDIESDIKKMIHNSSMRLKRDPMGDIQFAHHSKIASGKGSEKERAELKKLDSLSKTSLTRPPLSKEKNNDFQMGGFANLKKLSNLNNNIDPIIEPIDIEGEEATKLEDKRLADLYNKSLQSNDNTNQKSGLLNKALKYAPVAANLGQLASLNKPSYESSNRLDNRYQKQLVDEMQLQNQVSNQANASAEALANASGGNLGSLRANLLGNTLNKSKARGDAYMQANKANMAENARAQQFNLGVDSTNLQQANLEQDINARNLGAYDTQKSKLISQLGDDIGDIGVENSRSNKIAKMYGYDVDGNYLVNKKTGEKFKISDFFKKNKKD